MVTFGDVIKSIETKKHAQEFIRTGFEAIDSHLDGGLLRKEMVVLGAHTGIGKSYIAGQMMRTIAAQGFKTAYFSLEISNEMVVSRMIGSLANLKPTWIQTGTLSEEQFKEKAKAQAKLKTFGTLMEFYDDVYDLVKLQKEIKEKKYEFVVIDFIQNIYTKAAGDNERLTIVSLALQRLAKETDSCLLVLSQLSNEVARMGSQNKNPEYKGSGSIAMVCDLGFFMERDQEAQQNDIHKVNLTLKKNRRGSAGMAFELYFKLPGGELYEV